MSLVWSCNEWDPLEEVIIGTAAGARFPHADASTQLAEYPGRPLDTIPQGPFPAQILEEAEEDLATFASVLEQANVTVRRPSPWNHDGVFSTVHWSTPGYYNYCPRDILLTVGDQILETPNVIRGRSQETFSYRELLLEYMASGSRWFSAPRPMLKDELFAPDAENLTPLDLEPAFDAANVLRFGRDLLYLVSATGNEMGGHWLQSILGDQYRVHFMKDVYFGSHIDSTLVALRPGLVLANPERLSDETLPEFLKEWEVIYSPPMENQGRHSADYLHKAIGSEWIDMNLFSIDPDTVVVDSDQHQLIALLESKGMNVEPVKLRHSRMLGGGFHCVTLDVRRRGTLEGYFQGSPG
ncbi:MAG: inosamine-phosphate amidinotransferase 1 [Luminiphilus sp.]|nr:inosamine-phosphate amidinotransferase 1 [Luminiphilus sp.]